MNAAATIRRHRRLTWFLAGALSVFAGRWIVNHTPFADWLVAPLIRGDTSGPADAIVVLGGGVTESCTPNAYSLRRIVLGTRLFKAGRAPRLVITGGRPKEGGCPIAEAMAGIARDLGVPDGAMTIESVSQSTWENAEFSAPLLRALGARRILLVTDRLHMKRGEACFRRFGFHVERATVPLYESSGENTTMLYWGLREMAALQSYRWHGYINGGAEVPEPPASQQAARESVSITHPDGPIVLLGASYTANWKLGDIAGIRVINAGQPGQESKELLARFDADVAARQPRAVVIWGFINDIFRAPRSDVDAAVGRARDNMSRLVNAARQAGIEPVLMTELTITYPDTLMERAAAIVGGLLGKSSYADYINSHVLATNQWLRQYAAREGVLLLETEAAMSDASGYRRRAYATPDGSHISDAGYDALTRATLPVLTAHFGSKTRD